MFKYISNSREHQDLFILSVLDKKRKGSYVEIGASHFITGNNTYLLEKEFSWSGISVEFLQGYQQEFNRNRSNPCILADATIIDYTKLFEEYSLPSHIDFLQLDIDPPSNTLKVLQNIPFDKYTFSVITFEHDEYSGGKEERIISRGILENLGYTRVISDVMHGEVSFEDWYVKEEYMPNEVWKLFKGNNVKMNAADISSKIVEIFKQL
jgi:hypothetical protein